MKRRDAFKSMIALAVAPAIIVPKYVNTVTIGDIGNADFVQEGNGEFICEIVSIGDTSKVYGVLYQRGINIIRILEYDG